MNENVLKYYEERSESDNLYHALYDEWPKRGCPEYAESFLAICIEGLTHGKAVCEFFGLAHHERIEDMDEQEVRRGLEAVKSDLSDVIELLYFGCDSEEEFWQSLISAALHEYNEQVDEALLGMLISVLANMMHQYNDLLEVVYPVD